MQVCARLFSLSRSDAPVFVTGKVVVRRPTAPVNCPRRHDEAVMDEDLDLQIVDAGTVGKTRLVS